MLKIKNKNNIFIFIIIIIAVILSIKVNYNSYNNIQKQKEQLNREIAKCEESNNDKQDYIDYCESINEMKEYKRDFFSTFSSMLVFDIRLLNPLAFLIISIPTLYILYKKLKFGYFTNVNNRESYTQSLKCFFRTAYKYIWLLPVIALIFMIPIFFYTTLDSSYALKYAFCIWNAELINIPPLFLFLYLINLIIYSGIFINISLIVVRKKHNFIPAVILSYILYLAIEIFNEVFMDVILCNRILHIENGGLFNIMNLFTFNTQYGVIPLLLFALIVYVLTAIVVWLSYKNHEKLIIDCEKNDFNGGKNENRI